MLEWYRLRWQVELGRWPSWGTCRSDDDDSAKAWLYGKLFVALLVEKLIHHARDFRYDVRRAQPGRAPATAPAGAHVSTGG